MCISHNFLLDWYGLWLCVLHVLYWCCYQWDQNENLDFSILAPYSINLFEICLASNKYYFNKGTRKTIGLKSLKSYSFHYSTTANKHHLLYNAITITCVLLLESTSECRKLHAFNFWWLYNINGRHFSAPRLLTYLSIFIYVPVWM